MNIIKVSQNIQKLMFQKMENTFDEINDAFCEKSFEMNVQKLRIYLTLSAIIFTTLITYCFYVLRAHMQTNIS